MKTLKSPLMLIITVAATASTAFGHDMNMASSKEGLFGLKPDYLHILLNPLPVYGLGIGIVILAVGLLRRDTSLRIAGLVVTAICAASAWPVLYFGQHGYNALAPLIDTESHQWLDEHMNRAERFIYFFYATAGLAAAGLASHRRFPKAAGLVAILTLVLGAVSLGIAGWISRAGGQVSHSEFRGEGVPPPGGEMQMSHTGGGSKSDAPVEQSVVKTNR